MRIASITGLSGAAVLSLAMLFLAGRAAAQGPAGAGAAEAAATSSGSRSYNPTKWFGKKDAKVNAANHVPVEQLDQKLERNLRAAQLLSPNAFLKDLCQNFVERTDCVAALHASHSLGLNFVCVKASMTGIRTDADASTCHMPPDDKPLSLMKAIHFLKAEVNAKNAAKEAETAASEDLKEAAAEVNATPGQ